MRVKLSDDVFQQHFDKQPALSSRRTHSPAFNLLFLFAIPYSDEASAAPPETRQMVQQLLPRPHNGAENRNAR